MQNVLPLLHDDHPAYRLLQSICNASDLADSAAMEVAGFQWPIGIKEPRLYWQKTTLIHPDLPGYSVTVYPAKGSTPAWDKLQRDTHANLIRRDEVVTNLINERGWNDLTVAKRWLYRLGGDRYAVVAEELPRLPYKPNLDAHWEMEERILNQLLDLTAEIEVPFGGPLVYNYLTDGRVAIYLSSNLNKGLSHFASRFLSYLRPDLRPVARRRWTHLLQEKEAAWPPCHLKEELRARVEPHILSASHSAHAVLKELPLDRHLFADRGSLAEGGFEIVEGVKRVHHNQVMVAGHPKLDGYLIKSYPLLGDKISPYRRLEEYCLRCEQANRVRDYIEKNQCRYLTVPKKWVYWLGCRSITPRATSGSYLLIVERMVLRSSEEARGWYEEHMEGWIREVLELYTAMGGLDTNPENFPVTTDGKIALLDTEHVGWGRADRLPTCFSIMAGPKAQEVAKTIWSEL